jgi:galacturonokinase
MTHGLAARSAILMDFETTQARVLHELRSRYGIDPASARLVFAPYRICPLGAHVDHQLGPVTAMAIDQGVLLGYAASPAREVRLRSLNFPGEVRFELSSSGAARPEDWGNYARGAAQALARSGHELRRGLVGVMGGSWSESGLSSSAAVGIAYLLALEEANSLRISPEANIGLDQVIENDYLGLRNGILDQSGILLSRRNHLTRIECASGVYRLIPAASWMPPWSILLAFSGLRKALVGTDYNRRVAECEAAARILLDAAGRGNDTAMLGHVSAREYAEHIERLPEPLDRRAAHFFSEVERVELGSQAWEQGELRQFGRLMTASGESSIRNYECGSPPLIDLYEIMIRCDGVHGARFSGAGFRGCCVGLVDRAAAVQAAQTIQRLYAERRPELASDASVVISHSDDGARFLPSSGTAWP